MVDDMNEGGVSDGPGQPLCSRAHLEGALALHVIHPKPATGNCGMEGVGVARALACRVARVVPAVARAAAVGVPAGQAPEREGGVDPVRVIAHHKDPVRARSGVGQHLSQRTVLPQAGDAAAGQQGACAAGPGARQER
eukprot:CAMPEP_0202883150 /NCGR_PEP_ID=MMETSP1391-20130828/39039_1 /ASSEMBLY_ACC=CAM_ASM_000867 /TAXON_ID=1034604 /ORGANISM="Chlamydomonas leiostraca, Strain SAG 11-49" /LENGTH=137 /DNA_ID=CAMNT_0049566125 /DNA_START=580 /DNA_END=993 /DNA_ORIENTATION=+